VRAGLAGGGGLVEFLSAAQARVNAGHNIASSADGSWLRRLLDECL
jgi:hypothetical protein